MKKIFIDGRNGTTGLRIDERLLCRDDVEILVLPEDKRKDPASKKEMLNKADVVFLCLPDDAAKESVSMIENPSVTVIDKLCVCFAVTLFYKACEHLYNIIAHTTAVFSIYCQKV